MPVFIHSGKYFDETFLEDIFRIVAVFAIPHADTEHDRRILPVKHGIRFPFSSKTPFNYLLIGNHPFSELI
jgi:hypothetical protein